jgi:hypothetical protein
VKCEVRQRWGWANERERERERAREKVDTIAKRRSIKGVK